MVHVCLGREFEEFRLYENGWRRVRSRSVGRCYCEVCSRGGDEFVSARLRWEKGECGHLATSLATSLVGDVGGASIWDDYLPVG